MQPLHTTTLKYTGTNPSPVYILLIHGLFGDGSNLSSLGKQLSKFARVYLIDALNHGQSPRVQTMDYHAQAEALLSTMDTLGIDSCYLLGHSMGGKIAMATALLAPKRVAKLIVADIAPVTYSHGHQSEFNGLNSVNLNSICSRQDANNQLSQFIANPGVRQFLIKSLKHENQTWFWQFAIHELQQFYSDIINWPFSEEKYNGPTLFLKGALSDYLVEKYQDTILKQFPHAKVKILMNTGHWLHAEKPQQFNRLVSQFFALEN
ncbi:MAG: Esterase YbfF [Candidatus Celerinatantimonas neptuna]|nr:MAG: Esterase YbfF [Candidatus Celerinatantimonas neptuna]